jgi:hypothetical protein
MDHINPQSTDDLISHIFDSSLESLALFRKDFIEPVVRICDHIRLCYGQFLKFENHPTPDTQFMYVTAYVYTLVESLFSSTKLLVHGFTAPSGILFRVSLEAMAMAVLIGLRGDILVMKKKNRCEYGNFFEGFLNGKSWSKPHIAIKILEQNCCTIGLTEGALKVLKESKDIYNDYAHASLCSIRLSVISEEKNVFGGGYNQEQKPLFEKEIQIRKQFVEGIPYFLESLYKRVA